MPEEPEKKSNRKPVRKSGKRTDTVVDLMQLVSKQQASAYLHPVRLRILRMLAEERMTNSQVAEKLGVHPANLTHHFRKLKDAGLIKLVEKRDTGRVLEKYYRAVARSFEVRQENAPLEGLGAARRALELVKNDLQTALARIDPESREVQCHLVKVGIAPAKLKAFRRKLDKLVQEFRAHENDGDEEFTLNVSLYPGK